MTLHSFWLFVGLLIGSLSSVYSRIHLFQLLSGESLAGLAHDCWICWVQLLPDDLVLTRRLDPEIGRESLERWRALYGRRRKLTINKLFSPKFIGSIILKVWNSITRLHFSLVIHRRHILVAHKTIMLDVMCLKVISNINIYFLQISQMLHFLSAKIVFMQRLRAQLKVLIWHLIISVLGTAAIPIISGSRSMIFTIWRILIRCIYFTLGNYSNFHLVWAIMRWFICIFRHLAADRGFWLLRVGRFLLICLAFLFHKIDKLLILFIELSHFFNLILVAVVGHIPRCVTLHGGILALVGDCFVISFGVAASWSKWRETCVRLSIAQRYISFGFWFGTACSILLPWYHQSFIGQHVHISGTFWWNAGSRPIVLDSAARMCRHYAVIGFERLLRGNRCLSLAVWPLVWGTVHYRALAHPFIHSLLLPLAMAEKSSSMESFSLVKLDHGDSRVIILKIPFRISDDLILLLRNNMLRLEVLKASFWSWILILFHLLLRLFRLGLSD